MSLFGSLITGVSALGAQAQSLGMISNNIANVSTVGYKRREAAFQSLVTSESSNTRYTPGSVLARSIQRINSQGALQQTNSTTDVAISGNGFFAVQRTPEGLQETLYTRAGSFSEDANGFLRNTAGLYLLGWRLDTNGDLPAGSDDISSTEAVNVSLLGGLTSPTTEAQFSINLDASEATSGYPIASSTAVDFQRTLRVFDSLGEGQDLELQYIKHNSPTANATTSIAGAGTTRTALLTSFAGVDATETINIAVGSASANFTVTATSTVQDLIDFVNNDAALQLVGAAEFTTSGQINIIARNFDDAVAITNGTTTVGASGAASAIGFDTDGASSATTLLGPLTGATVIDSLGTIGIGDTITTTVGTSSDTFTVTGINTVQDFINQINTNLAGVARAELTSTGTINIIAMDTTETVAVADGVGTPATQLGFTATASSAPTAPTIFPDSGLENTANPFGWWQLSMVDLETGTVLSQGSINFASDGTINGLADASNEKAVSVTNINWANGSALQDISISLAGLTQFSGAYNVTSATQNGAELGLRTGVEIDRDGVVTARFSNGETSDLFKLPISTFTAPNGLAEQTGNAFIETAESGAGNLREAGEGGAGLVEGSSVETSNVDIAEEFTRLIVTQRAYSAGTKVIRTADEMTEELLRLR